MSEKEIRMRSPGRRTVEVYAAEGMAVFIGTVVFDGAFIWFGLTATGAGGCVLRAVVQHHVVEIARRPHDGVGNQIRQEAHARAARHRGVEQVDLARLELARAIQHHPRIDDVAFLGAEIVEMEESHRQAYDRFLRFGSNRSQSTSPSLEMGID